MHAVIEKAKELGAAIAASEEFLAYKAAEERQEADEQAQKLMAEYQEKRKDITGRMKGAEMTPEKLKGFQQEIQSAMAELSQNETVRVYLEAKATFNAMLTQVNSVLAYYVKGEEAEGGCSGDCGSCGGCH